MNLQTFAHSTLTPPSNGSTDGTFLFVYIFNHRTAQIKIVLLFFAPIFELKRLSVTFFLAECFFFASDFHCKRANTWLNYLVRSFLLLSRWGNIFVWLFFAVRPFSARTLRNHNRIWSMHAKRLRCVLSYRMDYLKSKTCICIYGREFLFAFGPFQSEINFFHRKGTLVWKLYSVAFEIN